ncbi:hypothetical protein CC86DRAFT_295892, partial [Ophiobolus disseminans]
FRVSHKVDRDTIGRLLDRLAIEQYPKTTTMTLTSCNFLNNVKMYQACLAFGLEYTHTLLRLNALRAEITARVLTFDKPDDAVEGIDRVVTCIPVTNPLSKHLVNTLRHRYDKKEIPNVEAYKE